MKQVRLGLVCYGGVSLAIYMHGQTKEMYKLARAAAHNRGAGLTLTDSEKIYADLLRELDLDVVIDAISGTSAGGINGIALAKALSVGGSLDALRDVWFDEISIQKMTNMPDWVPWWVIGAKELALTFGMGLKSAVFRAIKKNGVLDDTIIIKAAHDALKSISNSGQGQSSIMPTGHRLDLAVNTTDYDGYPYYIPVADPPRNKPVYDRRHNVPLFFWHIEKPNGQRGGNLDRNGMLTFACRSTSSFPGAFKPLRIEDITEHAMGGNTAWLAHEKVDEDFFSFYKFADYGGQFPTVHERCFIDGGVRDNKPFGHTIKSIMNRPADRTVVRRLLYLEPHPEDIGEKPKAHRPMLAAVIYKAMGLSGYESIHRELWALEEANRKAQRVQTYIHFAKAEILQMALDAEIDLDGDPEDARTSANESANADGVGLGAYVAYKLRGIPGGIADAICKRLNYPEQSSHAYFIRRIVLHYLIIARYFDESGNAILVEGRLPERSRDLLQALDIAYHIRRVRFVLFLINERLRTAEGKMAESFGNIKGRLWQILEDYSRLADGFTQEMERTIRELFAKETLDRMVRSGDVSAEQYATENEDELNRLLRVAMDMILPRKNAVGGQYNAVIADLSDLGDIGNEIRRQAVAFPFWDRYLYPIMEASGLSDFADIKVIRMSPFDSGQIMGYMGERRNKVDKEIHGMKLGHFGAFMKREWRECDYLWGRIDTAERLIDLLAEAAGRGDEKFTDHKKQAMTAILDSEESALPNVKGIIHKMRKQLIS